MVSYYLNVYTKTCVKLKPKLTLINLATLPIGQYLKTCNGVDAII